MNKVSFVRLDRQHQAMLPALLEASERVLRRGWFVRGPEGEAFEQEVSATLDGRPCLGVNSGTDAITLGLLAAGIGPGDEVITVSLTATPTVMAILLAGATPKLVEIDPLRYTIDPAACEAAITPRTKAVIVVHLYGQSADLGAMRRLCDARGLLLFEDCAQAQGARYQGRPVGTVGDLAAFSFYPTKTLGAAGDGGLLSARDSSLVEQARYIANCGMRRKYEFVTRGMNSRLDEMQAAILRAKLHQLDAWNASRRNIAAQYRAALHECPGLLLPREFPEGEHVYHLFVVQHPRRDELTKNLAQRGVETLVHYPQAIHQQTPYQHLAPQGSLPHSERAAARVLSLPLYPELTKDEIAQVIASVRAACEELLSVS
jgi:dTDP-4-amino-4,6-dideoxygalactose transaminase